MSQMSPERWNLAAAIFQTARAKRGKDRKSYLQQVCAGDKQLRREVDKLLDEDSKEDKFLEQPLFVEGMTPEAKGLVGRRVGHYDIVEKLGEGGMGVVYKARDRKLDRYVVMKFLSPRLRGMREPKQRFVQEAKAASALDHPNICTIHSIDQSPEGQTYIVMAYYEGQTLHATISEGPMDPVKAIGVATQMSRGLGKAHAAGIIHRDIKPANVIVTRDGVAKLLDFGVAKLEGGLNLTLPGVAMGTASYMSPEQTQGKKVDHRTDIWALGVLLQEMLTGEPPFAGDTRMDLFRSIAYDPPPPLSVSCDPWQPELDRILHKLLAKDLSERYQTMEEVTVDLERVNEQGRKGRESFSPSIAVLPFVNRSRDPEFDYFSDGLTEELINALSHVEGLRVVSRTTAFQYRERSPDIRQIGERLRVATVLEGRVRIAGNQVRISVELVNTADGFQVWSERFDGELSDIFTLQDEIANRIVTALSSRLRVGEKRAPATTNPTVHQLYLRGRYYFNRVTSSGLEKGIQCFRDAIDEDPLFAKAHAGLAAAYLFQGFWGFLPPTKAWPQARAAALEALKLDGNLAEAHSALGAVLALDEWNWFEARRELETAVRLSPGDPSVRANLAGCYLLPHGLLKEALEEYRQCLELDPLAATYYAQTAWTLLFLGRREESVRHAKEGMELSRTLLSTYWVLAATYLSMKNYRGSKETLDQAAAIYPDSTFTLSLLGVTDAALGNVAEARQRLGRLEALSEESYVAPTHIAWISVALADFDQAFHWLARAVQARDTMLLYVTTMPLFEPIRSSTRYRDLLTQIGLDAISL